MMFRTRFFPLLAGLALAVPMSWAAPDKALTAGLSDTYLISRDVQRFALTVEAPGRLCLEGRAWEAGTRDRIRLRARLLDIEGREVARASRHHYGPFLLCAHVEPGRYRLEVRGRRFGTGGEVEVSRYSIFTVLP